MSYANSLSSPDDTRLFRRTAAGQSALDGRDKCLTPRLRALMLMAEGKPVSSTAEIAAALGAPVDALDQLAGLGFFDAVASASDAASAAVAPGDPFLKFRAVAGAVREIAADTLGLRGFFFMLRIEKCATGADLEKLLPELMLAVTKKLGRKNAALIDRQLRSMLA